MIIWDLGELSPDKQDMLLASRMGGYSKKQTQGMLCGNGHMIGRADTWKAEGCQQRSQGIIKAGAREVLAINVVIHHINLQHSMCNISAGMPIHDLHVSLHSAQLYKDCYHVSADDCASTRNLRRLTASLSW